MRASTSVGPPAANGTISVIGREGKVSACDEIGHAAATVPIAAFTKSRRLMRYSPGVSLFLRAIAHRGAFLSLRSGGETVRQRHSSPESHIVRVESPARRRLKKMRAYAIFLQVIVSCTLLPPCGHAEAIDTEHLFGFMIGSDVGEAGEREFQNQTTGRFAKNTGTYRALTNASELEFVPVKNFRVEFAAV